MAADSVSSKSTVGIAMIGNGFAGAPVPEPSAVVLVLSGAVALLLTTGVRRRRKLHA